MQFIVSSGGDHRDGDGMTLPQSRLLPSTPLSTPFLPPYPLLALAHKDPAQAPPTVSLPSLLSRLSI
eukprot:763159-Hanusia_phi.AAC.6